MKKYGEKEITDMVFGNAKCFSKEMNEVLRNNIGKLTLAKYKDRERVTYHEYNKGRLGTDKRVKKIVLESKGGVEEKKEQETKEKNKKLQECRVQLKSLNSESKA